MGTTLAPGVRRTLSDTDLASFRRMLGYAGVVSDTPTTPDDPAPGTPQPTGNTNGQVRVARARITRGGTFIDSVTDTAPPEFEIAANPTLTDANLQTGTGWATQGEVAIAGGAAVLTETRNRQTRLNQVFIIGEHDRYLSFTVDGLTLDNATGPDDAFEAALLDANSGASLLATTGLTRNDAFLNVQANGSEHAGQTVTSTRNPDGSRTYRVDLSGIAAGTAVNLSFDLVGFAEAASRVTIRDLRLGVPETRDDSVATSEDTLLDIAALANDLDTDLPGFAPSLVSSPAHGEVSLNADGSFRYVPTADWNGEDAFSYTVSDGRLTATGRITLTVAAREDEDDDCHDDNGHHSGFGHSEHNGYVECDDERSACIVVTAGPKITELQAGPSIRIDCTGKLDDDFLIRPLASGMPEIVGLPQPDKRTLAEKTGLVVRLKG